MGSLQIKIPELRNPRIAIKDIEIDLQLMDGFEQKPQNFEQESQANTNKKTQQNANQQQQERFMVDGLLKSILQNLEVSIENVAIRVVTHNTTSLDEKVPTFLIRTNAISFKKKESFEEQATLLCDIQNLLGNKVFAISDISVHLMKEKFLVSTEYRKEGQFNSKMSYESALFPFTYPLLNHPSTILLIKAPNGIQEMNEETNNRTVTLNEDHSFLPSFRIDFSQQKPGSLSCDINMPLFEVQISIGQLKQINKFAEKFKPVQNLSTQDKSSQQVKEMSKSTIPQQINPGIVDKQIESNQNQLSENHIELLKSQIVQDRELMQSMAQLYEQQELNVELFESNTTSNMLGQTKQLDQSLLLGKTDGLLDNSGLADSIHPDLLPHVGMGLEESQHMSSAEQQPQGPNKTLLSDLTVKFHLGQFLVNILCSENQKQENIIDRLEQDSQKPINESAGQVADPEHDRIFKAFGKEINQRFPYQKFLLPQSRDNSDIEKSSSYEFSIEKIETKLSAKIQDNQLRSVSTALGVKVVQLQRIDIILKPETNSYAYANNHQADLSISLISDGSTKFFTPQTDLSESMTDYHDAQEVLLSSEIEVMKEKGQDKLKKKNYFEYIQLAEVVSKVNEKGNFFIHNQKIFELQNIINDQFCVTLSSLVQKQEQGQSESKTLLTVGKAFFSVTPSEVLTLLSLGTAPKLKEESLPGEKQKVNQNPQSKDSINIQMEGLEFDFHFHIQQADTLKLYHILSDRNCSIQHVLAYIDCDDELDRSQATSIGLNLLKIEFIMKTSKVPIFKIEQGDLVAKYMDGSPAITLLSFEDLGVNLIGMENRKQENDLSSSKPLEEIVEEVNQAHKFEGQQVKPQQDNRQQNPSSVIFRRQSSDNDINGINHKLILGEIHKIDRANPNFEISISKIQATFDSGDLQKALVKTIVQSELQVQNLCNIMDISTIRSYDELLDSELFFIRKRETISKPMNLKINIKDVSLQLLVNKKKNETHIPSKAIKFRVSEIAFNLMQQDRGTVCNILIGFTVKDIIVIDQLQTIYPNHILPHQQSDQELKKSYEESSLSFDDQYVELSFTEEIDKHSNFLFVHPSTSVHTGNMIEANVKISFINLKFFEEKDRASLHKIKSAIGRIIEDHLAIRQLATDLGELRKNPMQLAVDLTINHLTSPVSNQNMTLAQALSKVGTKIAKEIQKLKKDIQLDPFEAIKVDENLVSTTLDIQLKDVIVLYTPVLTREKIERLFGMQDGHPQIRSKAYDQELFRVQLQLALQLNNISMAINPTQKTHQINCRSFAMSFLSDNKYERWPSWYLYAQPLQNGNKQINVKSSQELLKKGFVSILAIQDAIVQLRDNVFSVKTHLINVSLAQDSMRDLIYFVQLTQFSLNDDFSQFEDTLEQSIISKSESQNPKQVLDESHFSNAVSNFENENNQNTRNPEELDQNFEQVQTVPQTNNPFKNTEQIPDEMFTVIIHPSNRKQHSNPFQSGASPASAQKSTKVNLNTIINPNYFDSQTASQHKLEQTRYRKIHTKNKEEKDLFCSTEFQFEINQVRVTFFGGKDFDFDNSEEPRIRQSNILRQNQEAQPQNPQRDFGLFVKDEKNRTMLNLEQDYILNSNKHGNSIDLNFSRKRKDVRIQNLYLMIQVDDFIVSRRHFPDQTFMQELNKNPAKIPTIGLKRKTFAISVRNFQTQHVYESGLNSLFESPYSYRYHNFLELSIHSEKDYSRNTEEHSIIAFFRPTKISITRGPKEFIENFVQSLMRETQTEEKSPHEPFDMLEKQQVFAKEPEQEALLQEQKTKQLIRNLVIRDSSLTVSVSGIFSSLLSVRDLTIPIQGFRLRNSQLSQRFEDTSALSIEEVQACVIDFYKNEYASSNRKIAYNALAVLNSFKAINKVTTFGSTLLSPVYKPFYRAYYFGMNGFFVGLSEGFEDWYSYTAKGTYKWYIYFM